MRVACQCLVNPKEDNAHAKQKKQRRRVRAFTNGMSPIGEVGHLQAVSDDKRKAQTTAATISRLKEIWKGEYECWTRRDLNGKHIVYL
jgi:hypothetical protein